MRYEIVAPPQARGEIVPRAGPTISRDKIDYEIFQLEDKVIFHIVNRRDRPIELSAQSVLFDATGHSFSIEPQTIAPDQSGRVIVPPSNPISRGPTSPISAEVRVGGYDDGGIIRDERAAYGSAPMARDFRWPGGRTARFRFVFQIGDETLTHEWTLARNSEVKADRMSRVRSPNDVMPNDLHTTRQGRAEVYRSIWPCRAARRGDVARSL